MSIYPTNPSFPWIGTQRAAPTVYTYSISHRPQVDTLSSSETRTCCYSTPRTFCMTIFTAIYSCVRRAISFLTCNYCCRISVPIPSTQTYQIGSLSVKINPAAVRAAPDENHLEEILQRAGREVADLRELLTIAERCSGNNIIRIGLDNFLSFIRTGGQGVQWLN